MSIGAFKKIIQLEIEVLQQGNEISSKKARKFYDRLISYYEDYMKIQREYWNEFSNSKNFSDYDSTVSQKWFHEAECVLKKVSWLQEFLRRFIEPVDQPANTANLNSLLKKQTFYIEMIESLAPKNELSPEDAQLQYEHVSQYNEKFISNQSEIMTLVEKFSFQDQVTVSKEIQQKVISVQKMLKEIFSPTQVNDNFSRMRRFAADDDFVESPYEIQKSLIEQIEMIELELNNDADLGAKEAKVLFDHLSRIHESFIKNQAEIESGITGSALDKELEFSQGIIQTVISLKTKLKQKFAPVELSSSNESKVVDQPEETKEADEAADLNSLLEVQKSLVDEIESICKFKDALIPYQSENPPPMKPEDKLQVESIWKRLPVLTHSFFSNHSDIGKLVSDSESGVIEQKEILNRIQDKLTDIQKQYKFYFEQL